MDFVYPFITSNAGNRELELSIASIKKFFVGRYRIFVIGDDPKLDGVNHIHIKKKKEAFKDVAAKLRIAYSCDDIQDEFVWMMDDLFFVSPFGALILSKARHNDERSGNRLSNWKPSNNWLKLKKKTMLELRDRGHSTFDFSTHCPMVFKKSKLEILFSEWLDHELWDYKIIYGNVFSEGKSHCRPWRWRWKGPQSQDVIQSGIKNAIVVNCTASGFDQNANEVLSRHLEIPVTTVTTMKTWEKDFALEKDKQFPCPENYRGEAVDVVNNKTCGNRSKRSEPIYRCNLNNNLVSIDPHKSAQKEGCCKRCDIYWGDIQLPIAITSLIPKEDEAQTGSLYTWKEKGLHICAVQSKGEIDKCSTLYPEVDEFIELEDSDRPKISDILKAAKRRFKNETLMLINADIGIDIKSKIPIPIDEVYAFPRYDYNKHGGKAKRHRWGLDVFILPPSALALIIDAPFQIGEPCWDYWIPFHFLHMNYPLALINNKIFFHKKHPKRWSKESSKIREKQLADLYRMESFYGAGFRKKLRKYERSI